MAGTDSARRSPDSKPSILSRDRDGREHRLGVVDHPAGLVTLYDDEMARIMHPAAAIELALALIHATKGHYCGIVGPLSGGY